MASAWDAYVETLKTYYEGGIAAAAIFGQNGSTWAQQGMDHASTNYTDIVTVCNLFNDPSAA
jgi:hypothetical protein